MERSSSRIEPEDTIVVLDFGSQTAQLIARRIRECSVYSALFSHDAPEAEVMALRPKGFILSGGPRSVYEPGAPRIPSYVFNASRPVLGICYGMQALTHQLGGEVALASSREYGRTSIQTKTSSPLLPEGEHEVWMSHGDRIESPPAGFTALASSDNAPLVAIADLNRQWYGFQFHPEVLHTPDGTEMLRSFALEICGARPSWTPESIVESSLRRIRDQVGEERVIAGVSGGVDSSVAAALVHRAVGDQLTCIFINNGLMRAGEPEAVASTFGSILGTQLVAVDASESFLDRLAGISDPEEKRKRIGEAFIRIFEQGTSRLGEARFLVQGTIYPDVIESASPERPNAARIKTHHNVGGLPPDHRFDLVEPLRFLFKDEVRRIGLELDLPPELVWRQPFPGPGLAVRCLGDVSLARLERLRQADRIVQEELVQAGQIQNSFDGAEAPLIAQAFGVLLPVRSVGVMGDGRTYEETLAIRAVTTEDFMTADWARIPHEILARMSNRIVNEVAGINRVVYDITSKPPGTIEWE
jgi:GMP synthase (glutamine-hydrolysing)